MIAGIIQPKISNCEVLVKPYTSSILIYNSNDSNSSYFISDKASKYAHAVVAYPYFFDAIEKFEVKTSHLDMQVSIEGTTCTEYNVNVIFLYLTCIGSIRENRL